MPSLLRSAQASTALAAPPARGTRLLRIPSAPARAPGTIGVARLLQQRRDGPSSALTTTTTATATKAMPTATAASAPAAAEQRPIPGEDLFMVRMR